MFWDLFSQESPLVTTLVSQTTHLRRPLNLRISGVRYAGVRSATVSNSAYHEKAILQEGEQGSILSQESCLSLFLFLPAVTSPQVQL